MDGARPAVEASINEVLAQPHDLVLDVDRGPIRPGIGPSRAWPDGLVAAVSVAGELDRHPGLGHPVGPGHLPDTTALEDHRIDHITSQRHPSTHLHECPGSSATWRPL